jgi:hypothetical protein
LFFDVNQLIKSVGLALKTRLEIFFSKGETNFRFHYWGTDYSVPIKHEFVRRVHNYDLSFLLERAKNPLCVKAFKVYFITSTAMKDGVFRGAVNPRVHPDGIWHLFLTYTPDYKHFCLSTWGRMLGHNARMSFEQVTRFTKDEYWRVCNVMSTVTGEDYFDVLDLLQSEEFPNRDDWPQDQAHGFEGTDAQHEFEKVLKH